jgi:hypothetical protein
MLGKIPEMLASLATAGGPNKSMPATSNFLIWRGNTVAASFNRVVFPAPFGPNKPVNPFPSGSVTDSSAS